ncbi:uncharacterized protein LOC133814885 [Humulus lupulus]|uniref:uncharacterized protein LOC133814885 n=1 Tax=Humulus lupulus TaxID=3486 RepID=UPI002B40FBE9|nr:uncharacterized protein LOC133814885 [Humulus lupulus]
MVVDASTNGALLSKSYNEAFEIIERISNNNYQWPSTRAPTSRKVACVLEVDAPTSLAAQVSSISNILKGMNMGQPMGSPPMGQLVEVSCVYYGDGHIFDNCPSNIASVFYMGNQNRNDLHSNYFNQSWRQHPNLSWSMLKDYMMKTDALIQIQAASMRNLENQVGQLANDLRNRPQGALPSYTENPRDVGKEQCKAITLGSGKELESSKKNYGHEDEPSSIQNRRKASKHEERSDVLESASAQDAAASRTPQKSPEIQKLPQQLPFPQRFQKQKKDGQFKKFLDMLRQLHINIPLVEALAKMPKYVKFMKDILTKKRRLGEFEIVALTKECSSFLQNKLPPKMKDPGSFTIPCTIGNSYCGVALCDLGASINLMPMSVYIKLGIGEVRPTIVTLHLADRSLAYLDGKIEDVLVKVDKFIFPAGFIVLDYEADIEVPIILGRPFLATGRTLIDVENGELIMRAQEEQVTFKLFNPIRSPDEVGDCFAITVKNSNMEEEVPIRYSKKVRTRPSPKEFESNNELGASINKAPSHLQEPHRKKKKKKKCGRKAHSQRCKCIKGKTVSIGIEVWGVLD